MKYTYLSVLVSQHKGVVTEIDPPVEKLVGVKKIAAFNALGAQGWKLVESNKATNMPSTMERDLILDYTFMHEVP